MVMVENIIFIIIHYSNY